MVFYQLLVFCQSPKVWIRLVGFTLKINNLSFLASLFGILGIVLASLYLCTICFPFLTSVLALSILTQRNIFYAGWFSHDPSILHKVGHVLLQLPPTEPKRTRRFLIADDLFQLSKVPSQKTINIFKRSTEKLSGCKLQFIRCNHNFISFPGICYMAVYNF